MRQPVGADKEERPISIRFSYSMLNGYHGIILSNGQAWQTTGLLRDELYEGQTVEVQADIGTILNRATYNKDKVILS